VRNDGPVLFAIAFGLVGVCVLLAIIYAYS